MNIEYKGGFIFVDGIKYFCSKKVEKGLAYCTNGKEYAESVEVLAYKVFVWKTRENDGLFYMQTQCRFSVYDTWTNQGNKLQGEIANGLSK